MAYPVPDPVWASDTNIATGTEAGTPTKVDPGSGYEQQGFVPGATFVGPYVNRLLNRLCAWLVLYVKDLHNQVEFLNKAYTWTAAHVFNGSTITGTSSIDMAATIEGSSLQIDHGANTFDYKAIRTNEIRMLPLTSGVNGVDTSADQWLIQNSSGHLESQGAGTRVYDFSVPAGSQLVQVSAWAEAPTGAVSLTVVDRTGNPGTGSVTEGGNFSATDTTTGTALELLAAADTAYTSNTGTTIFRVYLTSDQANQEVTMLFAIINNAGPR